MNTFDQKINRTHFVFVITSLAILVSLLFFRFSPLTLLLVITSLALIIGGYVWRLINLRKREQQERHQQILYLAEQISTLQAGPETRSRLISRELTPLTEAVRELMQHQEREKQSQQATGTVICDTTDRVADRLDMARQLAGQLTGLWQEVQAIRPHVHAVPPESAEQLSLAEQINRIRFELENFQQVPREMVELLKHTFSTYAREQSRQAEIHNRLITDVTEQTTGLQPRLKRLSNLLQDSRTQLASVHEYANTMDTRLDNLEQARTDAIVQLKSLSDRVADIHGQIDRIPDTVRDLGTSLTDLSAVVSRSRILNLNASVFAAEAGEFGEGFRTISNEMKQYTEETARLVDQLDTQRGAVSRLTEGLHGNLHTLSVRLSGILDAANSATVTTDEQRGNQSMESLRNTLNTQFDELAQLSDQHQHLHQVTQLARSNAAQPGADPAELRSRIDRMVIEADRFSERISTEVPNLLKEFGTVLDRVTDLHQNLNRIHALIDHINASGISEETRQVLDALSGSDNQLLRDIPKLLGK